MAKRKGSMSWWSWIAFVLTVIGALNWGLYAISQKADLVALIFGEYTMFARIVYGLVGIAGVFGVITGIWLAMKR